LNLNNPEPINEDERQIVEEVGAQIIKTNKLLDLISHYEGCDQMIREALGINGNEEAEIKAFEAVSLAVDKLLKFYNFSLNLSEMWKKLLNVICTHDSHEESIGNHQATVKLIAEIFKFAFLFDKEKITHPSIQNDFAYFRRVSHRRKAQVKKRKHKVEEDVANKMSFFFAYPTPLMKILIDATTNFKHESMTNNVADNLIAGLSYLADTCTKSLMDIEMEYENLEEDITNGDDHNAFLYLSTLAGCIILVDHLHPSGAFNKKSPLLIKAGIERIVNYQYVSNAFLINALRFTTLHLNDENTINVVKNLLNN